MRKGILMDFSKIYRASAVIIVIIAVFLGLKVLFPLCLPFLLGGLLSVAAEPAVRFGCEKCRLKRPLSAFFGVSLTLALVACGVILVGGIALREVKELTRFVPELQQSAQDGIQTLEQSLLQLAGRLPDNLRDAAEKTVTQVFTWENGLLAISARKLPELAAGVAGKVPAGALSVGTGLLSAFLISARLPRLKQALERHIPKRWTAAWAHLKHTLGKWLVAQGKLMGVTFVIVTAGLLLLGISRAPMWAALVALVDAVPLLGTGIILLPWALVKWMQGQRLTAIGLGCVYAAAALTRAVLEPRLVGRQLGIDPLIALAALYAGFRLWGFWGLVLAPVAAALVKNLIFRPSG